MRRMNGMLLVVVLVLGLIGCDPPTKRPNFYVGELVEIKIDGNRAIVTKVGNYPIAPGRGWYVWCRVSKIGQKHRDGVFSKDTELVAYPFIRFRAYELSKLDEKVEGE